MGKRMVISRDPGGKKKFEEQPEAAPGIQVKALREQPELLKTAAAWFAEKWEIPAEAYLDSMERCRQQKTGVPQWYVLVGENGEICAGAGLIENDFHSRKDLVPNVCALFVEKPYRNRGLARYLLDLIRREAGKMGYEKLYLVTDHMRFYEKCGWHFLTMAKDEEAMPIRVYEILTEK